MSEATFWEWSCTVYAAPDVRDACLSLQDDAGLSVNLALWCAWLAATGRTPSPETAAQAGVLSEAFQAGVVGRLRAARRWLKSPAPALEGKAATALRKQIMETELAAERLEQDALWAASPPATGAPPGPGALARAAEIFAIAARRDNQDAHALLTPLIQALAAANALQI